MLVSVLIVTYNHERYIREAIESVLFQNTTHELEIIVLDDHSTDNTVRIASDLLRNIAGTKIIVNDQNLGITKNYQKGFKICSGDYLVILEGDDYWVSTLKVQSQIDFLETHPYHSMCFTSFIMREGESSRFRHFKDGERAAQHLSNYSDVTTSETQTSFGINHLIQVEGLIGTFSVCCYRKALLEKIPPAWFETTSYDWAINLQMADFGMLGRLNEVMGVYRLAEKATWSLKTKEEQTAAISDLIPQYDRLLGGRYKDLFELKLKELNTEPVHQKTKSIHSKIGRKLFKRD